jgi:hypothetical protein
MRVPPTIRGRAGTYPCPTIAAVDKHLAHLTGARTALKAAGEPLRPRQLLVFWHDVDQLLDARLVLAQR